VGHVVLSLWLSHSQVARELVARLIRDKDLGDFRVGKADFGSKMGGNSLDVSYIN